MSSPMPMPPRGRLSRRLIALVSAAALSTAGLLLAVGPAHADFTGPGLTIAESADPVAVGASFTYTMTAIAATDCGAVGEVPNCDVGNTGEVDLRHDAVQATITAASGSSVNGPASCNIQFNPGFGYDAACSFGTVPHGTTVTWTVTVTAAITGTIAADILLGDDYSLSTVVEHTEDTTVIAAAPTVTAVSPNSGPPAGGTAVTISGTALTGATITFGVTPATGVSCTSTSCTATAPAGTAGTTVDVQATTGGGTSTVSAADQYTYTAADVAVTMTADGDPGLLLAHIDYTVTITNNGPSTLTSATVTAPLPTPMTATSPDCTIASGPTVTCTLGTLTSGSSTTRHFTVPIALLTLNHAYTVTATRTTSTPVDTNPANDNTTRTCTILTSLILSCH